MTAGHRAFKIHAESAEVRTGRAELHIFGTDIRRLREAEANRPAGMAFAEAGDARVVGIQYGDSIGRQPFDQFTLRGGNAFDGIEELHVGVADVGDHTDVGFGDSGKPADFSRVVHAYLDDSGAAPIGQAKQGQRHTDVVIEIAGSLAHGQFCFQQVRDCILGRGLARTARHGDHLSSPLLARPRAQLLEGALRIRHYQFAG